MLSSASKFTRRILSTIAIAALLAGPSFAQTETTSSSEAAVQVDERYVWDLTSIYPSVEAWDGARIQLQADIESLKDLEGSLGESPEALESALDLIFGTLKETSRVYIYASLEADEDIRDSEADARRQQGQILYTDFVSAVSWMDPELLSIGEDTLMAYIEARDGLADYRFYLENLLRSAPHTLEPLGERILASAGPVTAASSDTYNIFTNAELPWPEIELSNGETVTVNKSGYVRLRQLPDRADRKAVFDAFWLAWATYENTFGAILGGHLKGLQLATRERNYSGSVDRAFAEEAMPKVVYETLIEEVNASLPTLHRYFKLRKRMLGIEEEMRYFDIYPPLVELDKTYTIEDSIEITRRALSPLGDEFLAAYDLGVSQRWMHVYPQEGKRSGAYMNGGVYDEHPFVLLNHNDDFQSASTFAHEYGHAVHSVLANEAQPYATARYSIFIAETASIMLEMLLENLVISEAETPEERLYYLGNALESLRGTYYRQAMFAEFEYTVNGMADASDPLTGEKMTEIYLDLLKRYHAHDENVVVIDDLYGIEWAYIPHFYYDFYVFQYATSIAAASSLAEQISSGDTEARDRFITLLKAGGSAYPYELMKEAGVDLATPDAHRALDRRANAIMDEMEAILTELEASE